MSQITLLNVEISQSSRAPFLAQFGFLCGPDDLPVTITQASLTYSQWFFELVTIKMSQQQLIRIVSFPPLQILNPKAPNNAYSNNIRTYYRQAAAPQQQMLDILVFWAQNGA